MNGQKESKMSKSEWIYFLTYRCIEKEEGHPMVIGPLPETQGIGNGITTLTHPISSISHIDDIQRIIKEEKGFDTVVITSITLL